jgi:hypothetical protein
MQTPKISRAVQFVGAANNKDNVEGNPSFNRMVICDDFNCVTIDATNDYTVTVAGTNDAVAVSNTPGAGGWVSMLSGDTDDEVCYMATPLIFDISKNPVCEARVQLSDVSQTSFFFGFSDAITESTPDSTIDYADATLAAIATDAVGFVIDADKLTSTIYAAAIATGGSVGATTTGLMATDSTTLVLRVALNSSGDAEFSVNGVIKVCTQTAVTDVPLCVMFNAGTRDNGGGDAVYIDYLKA